ncbi:MAG: OmpA family protein [Pseudomonadota bacterium]
MVGRFVDWIIAVIALAGLTGTVWWSVYGSPNSAHALEADLQTKAETALAAAGHGWAKVVVSGQTATISGQSPSHDTLQAALETVLQSAGDGGFIFGGITAVSDAVEAAPPISPYIWSVKKMADGRLALTGHVPTAAIRDALLTDAEAIAPGEVDNRLQIGSGQPLGDWQAVARRGLMQLDLLDEGTVELVDSRLLVRGVAASDEIRTQVISDIGSIAGSYRGETKLRGAQLWAARLKGGDLIVSGQVRSVQERGEVIALANEYFEGDVQDRMTVAAHDHRSWMDGIRLGLPHFSKFRTGQMAFDPEGDGYRIQGTATDSVLSYLSEDMADIDAFAVAIDVELVDAALDEISGIDFSSDLAAACQQAFAAVLASNAITFESSAATITRDSGITLDKLIGVARRCDGLFLEVRGHTDSYGERAFNIQLSEARAAAVINYMTDRGLAADRFDAVGLGPDLPIATNDTRAGRAANRRIEFNVIEGGG